MSGVGDVVGDREQARRFLELDRPDKAIAYALLAIAEDLAELVEAVTDEDYGVKSSLQRLAGYLEDDEGGSLLERLPR